MTQTIDNPGGWRALFSREYRAAITVLAGGVLLFATNVYLTTSLLPSAIADIGGRELYAWAMTAFLVAAVVSSMFVSRVLALRGARTAYLLAFALFAAGTVIAALAPTMPVLLAGRAVQGLGGGMLAALGYAVIRQTLPDAVWSRALGVVSAMWGVGNLIGPAVGGLFAQLHIWRFAFVALAVGTGALALLAARFMPTEHARASAGRHPGLALASVTGAAALVSVASIVHGWPAVAFLVGGGVLLVAFVLRERTARERVLPTLTYRRGNPLKWVYASLALLAVGSTAETFLPLFGQRLGGLDPLLAGMFGAALSFGWTIGSVVASNFDGERARARARALGPVLLAAGLAVYALLQRDDASTWTTGAWALALFVGGAGIGMAFQHGVTAAMSSTTDEAEATRAATGVTTVQEMANALGSALGGVLVNLGGASVLRSTQLLLWTFVAVAGLGVLTAHRANSRLHRQDDESTAQDASRPEHYGAAA